MYVSHLGCPRCGATYESEKPIQVCRCSSPLLVRYDLKKVGENFRKDALPSLSLGRTTATIRKQ